MHKPSGNIHHDTTGKRGKKGSYYVRFRFPDPITGQRKEKIISGFKTQKEAKDALAGLTAAHVGGELVVNKQGFTVNDGWKLYKEELELRVELGKLKQKTLDSKCYVWRTKVEKRWGHRIMAEIRPLDIIRFMKDTPKNQRHVYQVVKHAFDTAHRNGAIGHNPFSRVRRADFTDEHTAKVEPEQYWTTEQLKIFREAAAADNDPHRWFWDVVIFTGMRRGEVLGICDDALDFSGHPTLELKRQVAADIHGHPVWSTPKTEKSVRTIALIEEAATAIREQQFLRASYALADYEWDTPWHRGEEVQSFDALEMGAVFVNPDGGMWRPESYGKRFQRYVKKLGLPPIGLHGLRHTFATAALDAGVPLKVLSQILGHSRIEITADVYQHVTAETSEAAFEQVAGLIR